MKTMIKTTLGLATALAFASAAQADDMSAMTTTADAPQSATTHTVKTIDANGTVSMKTVSVMPTDTRRTAVLGALAVQTTDAYVVEDNDGDLYLNHLIPVAELPDPTLDVETEDTYTIEYRGMTFTNRIVAD